MLDNLYAAIKTSCTDRNRAPQNQERASFNFCLAERKYDSIYLTVTRPFRLTKTCKSNALRNVFVFQLY